EGLVGSGGDVRQRWITGVNIADGTGVALYDANQDIPGTMKTIQACSTAFQTAVPNNGLSSNRGQHWSWGSQARTMFSTVIPPASTQYQWGQCRFACQTCGTFSTDHSHITNATSNHPGGANVLFGDGGVRFVKGTVAMNIWWALGTRANDEVISSDSY